MTGQDTAIPSFRYPLPRIPLAGAVTTVGRVSVSVRLGLGGVLDVFTNGVVPGRGISRIRALTALDTLAAEIFVQGMDSGEPRISCAAGHRFRQQRARRDTPATLVFEGVCGMDFTSSFSGGGVRVTGEVDYRLEVRASSEPSGRPASEFTRELSAIGGLALVGTSISELPELRNRLELGPV
jgi:hypothetical protein